VTIAATIILITVHMIDGRVVQINPAEITSLTWPKDKNSALVDGVHCVISLTDGKFLSVAETCDEVEKLIED
jgi:uncharacterized protein YlzI (FlbEa/FlbD family)